MLDHFLRESAALVFRASIAVKAERLRLISVFALALNLSARYVRLASPRKKR
jgi:hypothetical protein